MVAVEGTATGVYHALLYPDGDLRGAVNDMDAQARLEPHLLTSVATLEASVAKLLQAPHPIIALDANLPPATLRFVANLAETRNIPRSSISFCHVPLFPSN